MVGIGTFICNAVRLNTRHICGLVMRSSAIDESEAKNTAVPGAVSQAKLKYDVSARGVSRSATITCVLTFMGLANARTAASRVEMGCKRSSRLDSLCNPEMGIR